MRAMTFLLCAAAVIVGLVAGQNSTEAPSRVSVAATIAVPGTAFAQILFFLSTLNWDVGRLDGHRVNY
jgi:hypothetical protein